MTLNAVAPLEYLATLCSDVSGVQASLIGAPKSLSYQSSILVTLGKASLQPYGTQQFFRLLEYRLRLAYVVNANAPNTEQAIASVLDSLSHALRQSRTLNHTVIDTTIDFGSVNEPAYDLVAGQEVRFHECRVVGKQLGSFGLPQPAGPSTGLNENATLAYLAELCGTIAGIQAVYVGAPKSLSNQVDAILTLGGGRSADYVPNAYFRWLEHKIELAYMTNGNVSQAELTLAAVIDSLTGALYADQSLGSTSHEMQLDLGHSDDPEYKTTVGQEYRLWPFFVLAKQLDTSPIPA